MEPGHEDREYLWAHNPPRKNLSRPQWSPVMKTGNTRAAGPPEAPPISLNGARS